MVKFMKNRLKKAKADYEDCITRIHDVLSRIENYNDELMDIHFEALYSMMKEKGYSEEETDYIIYEEDEV